MTPDVISSLIDLGAAGAVIGVVVLFLRFIQKQQTDWQSFFKTMMSKQDQPMLELTKAIKELTTEFKTHDTWEHTELGTMKTAIQNRPTRPRKAE